MEEAGASGAIAQFLDEAAALVARSGPDPGQATFAAIGERLRRLAEQPGMVDDERLAGLHGSSASAAVLGRHADGSLLMLARFPAEEPTPIHNHNSWGVVCVLRGQDRYERWERLDGGSDPDRAEIRLAEELILEPGQVVWFDGPPGDLHAQQGIDSPVWELVYFGRDPFAAPRAYFDPRTGAVTFDAAIR